MPEAWVAAMQGRFAGWWVVAGIRNMQRPGRNRGAIYGAKSRGQSLGLRLVIRYGGCFFLCVGFAIRRRVL